MNSERLTQGRVYAGDSDYDALHGRVTYERTTRGMTLDGWQVDYTVTYIDLGRCADIDAPDPDVLMQRERFPTASPHTAMALEGQQAAKAERFRALRDDVATYIAKHGPASANAIAEGMGTGGSGAKARVLDMLRRCQDRFVYHGGEFSKWGLVGQPYAPTKARKRPSATMLAVRAALETYGPQSASELAERIGARQQAVIKSVMARPEWFVVVEVRRVVDGKQKARVWGLVPEGDDFAELAAHWPSLADCPDGVDIYAGIYPVSGEPSEGKE